MIVHPAPLNFKLIQMSKFIFKARKTNGEVYSGEKEATDRYEIYRMLRESGADVVSVRDANEKGKVNFNISLGFASKKVKMADKINFARNLGSMLEAGLALSRALSVLERQTRATGLKSILHELIAEIDRGMTFAHALEKYPKVFPALFVSMVRAGEQGGTLAEALKTLATQMESIYLLEKRIKGALMYPSVILCVMILIGILMFIFVIPTLLQTFIELKVSLPPTTQFLLTLSNIIKNQGIILLSVLLLVGAGLYTWSKKASGKFVIHGFMLKLPIIGSLVQEVNSARAARTLASLMSSGVNVVESLDITSTVVQNVHFRAVLEKAREAIKKGDLMSKIFMSHTNLYPVFFAEMLSVGEETGKITEMLLGVAHYYETDVDQKTRDMSTVIEPFLIVGIGGAVAFFAIAMISPMYSLVNAI